MHETYYGDKSYETDNGVQSGGKADLLQCVTDSPKYSVDTRTEVTYGLVIRDTVSRQTTEIKDGKTLEQKIHPRIRNTLEIRARVFFRKRN